MRTAHRSQTFRVFVSSTFDDFETERNALQDRVFPNLREYCEARSFRFEPIDLRWGVNEEAGLDQQTMRICLRELENCQRISPRPNFIILAGDRYGWQPLPFEVEADEFAQLMARLKPEEQAWLKFDEARPEVRQGEGNGWYRRDDNAVPPAFVLLPREPETEFSDRERWEQEEATLQQILRSAAAKQFPDPAAPKHAKYFHSAIHQEIQAGLFANPDAKDHVFAYFREGEISVPSLENQQDADVTMIHVLREQIASHLAEDHIYRYSTTSENADTDQIDAFCDRVEADVKRIIDEEIARHESAFKHDVENELHRAFAEERTDHFVGREEPLGAIAHYIASDSIHPFFVHGVSGSGKTALLAEAWRRTDNRAGTSIARFISATPNSGNLENLLTDLCQQLEFHFGPLEEDAESESTSSSGANINRLTRRFEALLQRCPAKSQLTIFIDAIDQLTSASGTTIEQTLYWLPHLLPAGVSLVISALHRPTESDETSPHSGQNPGHASYYARNRFPQSTHLDLTALTEENARDLLCSWLVTEKRSLSNSQELAVLTAFQVQGLPLWLRLAVDYTKRLHSFDLIPKNLPENIHELISARMEQLSQEKNHGRLLVHKTLGYLNAAVNGLLTTELLDVLARDEEFWEHFTAKVHHKGKRRQIPVVLWARLHADVATYLTERRADGTMLHTIYHRVIAEWIGANIPAYACHDQLSRYFSDQSLYLDGTDVETASYPNLRKLNELVPQQIKTEQWDALIGSAETPGPLTDLRFVQAKCEAGLGYELLGDYNAARAALPQLAEEQYQKDVTREQCRVYGENLARFARQSCAGEILDMPVPPTCTLASSGLRQGNKERSTATARVAPTIAERLQHFVSFYSTNQHVLLTNPELTLLQAYSQAKDGVVSEQADLLLSNWNSPWIARATRPKVQPIRPAELTILKGHSKEVTAVALSPDGTRALSGAFDNTLRLWDTRSGVCLAILEGHTKRFNSVAFSADTARALSGAGDGELRIWDTKSGACIAKFEDHTGTAALSADGTRALSGAPNNTIRLWDIESGDCIASFEGHTKRVRAAALNADATRALSGSSDSTLRLWDTATGGCITVFSDHSDEVKSVAFTADGLFAVSGSRDKTLRFWDIKEGICLRVMKGHSSNILTVALSADGTRAISGSEDKTLRIWDTKTGACLAVLEGHADYVVAAALSANGSLAISAGSYGDRTLRLWDIEKGHRRVALEGHTGTVQTTSFSTDFKRALSGSWDETLRIWDPETGGCLATLEGHTAPVWAAEFSPNRSRVVSASWDDTVRIWDAETGNLLTLLEGHANRVWAVAFSLDGKRVLSGGGDNTLRIWDTENGGCTVCEGHTGYVQTLAISADGTRILSGSSDNSLRIWDVESGVCLATLEGHTGDIEASCWSPNCRFILSGSADNSLRIWDAKSGACQAVLTGHTGWIKIVAWSADGKRALSGGGDSDHTLRLWDPESGDCLSVLKGHTGVVTAAAFSSDGDFVCSGSHDSTLCFWNAKDGICLTKYHAGAPINSLDVNFEDGSVLCGCSDGQVHFLKIRNLKENRPLVVPETSIHLRIKKGST